MYRVDDSSVAVVADSNAMLPRELVDRLGVAVVPMRIVIDGDVAREGVDIDDGQFFDRLERGATITTAAPSPAEVLDVYQTVITDGATSILSIHVGSALSATLDSARIASRRVDVSVELVDTHTASFAAGCCVWGACETLESGGSVDSAIAEAQRISVEIGNTFVAGVPELLERSGRSDVASSTSVQVVGLVADAVMLQRPATDLDDAIETMAGYIADYRPDRWLRVAVGDAQANEAAEALEHAVARLGNVAEVVRYSVGPSVAAHTGTGTVGAVFYPLPEDPTPTHTYTTEQTFEPAGFEGADRRRAPVESDRA